MDVDEGPAEPSSALPSSQALGGVVDSTQAPSVSVIIPSWSGDVSRLRGSLDRQTYRRFTVQVVKGVAPAARARNMGVAATSGDLLLFVDDDAYFGHERVLETLVETLMADPTVGVVGPSKLIPPSVNWLQRRIASEVPRWVYPVTPTAVEANPPLDRYGFSGITTTCCLMPRAVFDRVGGFDERLPTGEDTALFYRIHRAGYRFVIPGRCWVYHDPPRTLGQLVRKSFRYGVGHALEARDAPERRMDVLPLDRWYGKLLVACSPALFIPSVFVNVYFEPVRHLRVGFRPLKALSTLATFYGYVWGWYRGLR
jgi:cellulose synthase/poly-beta-1,6-N-acetylglucosamine synthase-like glycosyltransferase